MNETETKIAEMLTTSTGTHFLDSGGESGRHWQRNQGRDFEKEPETMVEFSTYRRGDSESLEIMVTHNVYHWLRDRIEYDEEMDNRFTEWCDENGEYRDLGGIEGFMAHLADTEEAGGIYGEGEPLTVNTYNGEDLLSQVLQYGYFETYEGAFVLLQIHNGADVRGGYTDAVAFRMTEELAIMDNARAGLYVDEDTIPQRDPNHGEPMLPGMPAYEQPEPGSWYTDDGCNFYTNDNATADDLGRYPVVSFEEGGDGIQRDADGRTLDSVRGTGVVCVDDDRNAYCPVSGGKLLASPY